MTRRLSTLSGLVAPIAFCLLLASCSSSDDILQSPGQDDAPWAASVASILTGSIIDPAQDYDPSEPPYQVDFQAVDLLTMSFGVDQGYLYIRLDYSGVIPEGPVSIEADGVIEAQIVTEQSTSFVIDTDNNDATGAGASNFVGNGGMQGVDIFFGISVRYDSPLPVDAYANYDFTGGDIHLHNGQILGEFGAGGPGHDFIIARFDISGLEHAFWPGGDTVEVGGWAEAESDLYHEFVNDFLTPVMWTLPEN